MKAEDVRGLGIDLLSSTSNINNLPLLLSFLSPSSPPDLALEAILALHPFFLTLLPDIQSSSTSSNSKEEVYKDWLRSRFNHFLQSLVHVAVADQSHEPLRDVVIDVFMEFVKLGKQGHFQSHIYHKFVNALVCSPSTVDHLLTLFVPNFFKFVDVRFYTYISIFKIVENWEKMKIIEKNIMNQLGDCHGDKHIAELRKNASVQSLYKILSQVPPLESQDDESQYSMWSERGLRLKVEEQKPSSDASLEEQPQNSKKSKAKAPSLIAKKLKGKFRKAWISFLRLPLSLDVYKEVLASIHQIVIPNIADPIVLCDFLTKSYDMGGVISVMALSGLFVLITKHGLEYPNFYAKLYALLTPDIFMAKYRARFFQLLDTSLTSAYLPAYLAAAFAKKMSRLSLVVPPAGSLIIIAVIHNLLYRHPSINFLVHKLADGETEVDSSNEENKSSGSSGKPDGGETLSPINDGSDPFKMEESDPMKCDAMRSSLWEIDTLRNHYCPAVSRFVASLKNDLTVRRKASEITVADFTSGSYGTIFGDEVHRRIKQVPLAFYRVTPTSLFSGSDFRGWSIGGETGDIHQDRKTEADSGIEQQDSKRQRVES